MLNLLEQTSSLKLKIISILKECIIFGFPDHIPETKGKHMSLTSVHFILNTISIYKGCIIIII